MSNLEHERKNDARKSLAGSFEAKLVKIPFASIDEKGTQARDARNRLKPEAGEK